VPVVAQMERHGIRVDREVLAGLSSTFATEIARLEAVIHEKAGGPFTIGSPKQLGDVLFDKLGYKGGKKGKSGQYSTDQSVLETLAGQGAEVATLVLEWRQLSKLKSTYTDALQAAINPDTGRVHTSYSLVGAQTGRLSSNDPNLQNIPIRTEIGRQIREAFVAEPGHVLLSADYSQIELRLAAHIADVAPLREAFEQGEDIHARTARELFGEVNRDTRGRAKTINFAILYGISRWGLATRLGTSADEAQAMIDRYFERFPGIQRYIHETLESVRALGYSETLFGRKTWFPRINSKTQAERQGSERAAINAPIQGTSADIIKRAMARMGPALAEAGLSRVKMLLQVHDELVFELPEDDVAKASEVIRAVMSGAAAPSVHLTVPWAWRSARGRAGARRTEADMPSRPLPQAGGGGGHVPSQQLPPIWQHRPAPCDAATPAATLAPWFRWYRRWRIWAWRPARWKCSARWRRGCPRSAWSACRTRPWAKAASGCIRRWPRWG
jgi:DNA polymerase-1